MKFSELSISEILKAIGELAWPVIVGFLLWRLFPLVRALIESRAFTVKVAGMEISVQEASRQIQAQIDDLSSKVSQLRQGANLAPLNSSRHTVSRLGILWVDDVPSNNAYAVAQLKNRGYEVDQAGSTMEALRFLHDKSTTIGAVLSDMGREEQGTFKQEAGLDLLNEMRRMGCDQPYLVCTTSDNVHRYDAIIRNKGGDGATSSVLEVLEFVERVLAPIGTPASLNTSA